MVTEQSRFREGENPRSDQIRSDTTSNNGQMNDLLKHFNQFHDQQEHKAEQHKGKGIMTLEMESKSIQDQKEKHDKNESDAIQEIIDQRQGINSPQSNFRLG